MTKRVYLDANILIAHQVAGHKFHESAKTLIDALWKKRYTFVLSSLTMDECFYGVIFLLRSVETKQPYKPFRSHTKTLLRVTEAILSWDLMETIDFMHTAEELRAVIGNIASYNLRPRDAFHLRIMQQQSIDTIATFDHDFETVPNIHIIGDIHTIL